MPRWAGNPRYTVSDDKCGSDPPTCLTAIDHKQDGDPDLMQTSDGDGMLRLPENRTAGRE